MTEIGIIRALPVEALGDNRTGMRRTISEISSFVELIAAENSRVSTERSWSRRPRSRA